MEAARLQCGEQRAQRCIEHWAVFVLLLAFFTVMDQRGSDDYSLSASRMLVDAGFDELDAPQPAAIRSGDGDWRFIDALTKLRRQQAQVLRLSI